MATALEKLLTRPKASRSARRVFQIEKNVPPPAINLGRRPYYPFGDMEIGDSIVVRTGENIDAARRAATAYGKRHNRIYVTRTIDEGLRIWRLS